MRNLAILALVLASSSAVAETGSWTPAPVPSGGAGDTVLPAARAGERVVDDHDTPFSSVPSASVSAGGATSANQFNGVGTPNLSK